MATVAMLAIPPSGPTPVTTLTIPPTRPAPIATAVVPVPVSLFISGSALFTFTNRFVAFYFPRCIIFRFPLPSDIFAYQLLQARFPKPKPLSIIILISTSTRLFNSLLNLFLINRIPSAFNWKSKSFCKRVLFCLLDATNLFLSRFLGALSCFCCVGVPSEVFAFLPAPNRRHQRVSKVIFAILVVFHFVPGKLSPAATRAITFSEAGDEIHGE